MKFTEHRSKLIEFREKFLIDYGWKLIGESQAICYRNTGQSWNRKAA